MSHWTSGLPKLDIEPFDPTPLWDAAEDSKAEAGVAAARRRWMVPLLTLGVIAVVAGGVGIVALMA